MPDAIDLGAYLDGWAGGDAARGDVAVVVMRLSEACRQISCLVGRGALAGALGSETGKQSGIEPQKDVDVRANDVIVAAVKEAPVASLGSEELEWALPVNPGAPLAVAIDPIDGSSNIDANVSVGTIFTILPALANGADASSFLQPGTSQLAAGFALYGPFTSLVLTVGHGTHIFTLDRGTGRFMLTHASITVPMATREYSINASNYRHWDEPVRTYIDDCVRGRDGPRGKDFNMRWTASPVADMYRLLTRGGNFSLPCRFPRRLWHRPAAPYLRGQSAGLARGAGGRGGLDGICPHSRSRSEQSSPTRLFPFRVQERGGVCCAPSP